ncbi:hypothetical protein DM43_3510 [Burkholderia cepacia]|uniref:Uncharacterized protein n=1 Tax=Burkholderia cepacia TaxID=292 RepID=A0AA88Z4V3_BURCE|nr:hypothetical protein DM43_3510 [Burkholderia cepacia]
MDSNRALFCGEGRLRDRSQFAGMPLRVAGARGLLVGELPCTDQVLGSGPSRRAEQRGEQIRPHKFQDDHFGSFACICFSSSGE